MQPPVLADVLGASCLLATATKRRRELNHAQTALSSYSQSQQSTVTTRSQQAALQHALELAVAVCNRADILMPPCLGQSMNQIVNAKMTKIVEEAQSRLFHCPLRRFSSTQTMVAVLALLPRVEIETVSELQNSFVSKQNSIVGFSVLPFIKWTRTSLGICQWII
jgi:hypothetical protein